MEKDWLEILKIISEAAYTHAGADYLKALMPLSQKELEKEYFCLFETEKLVSKGKNIFRYNIDEVNKILGLIDKGEAIKPIDLRLIAELFEDIRNSKEILKEEKELKDILTLFAEIPSEFELEELIKKIVTKKGEISSQASEKLFALRNELSVVHGKIASKIRSMLKDSDYEDLLQEDYFTIREDRYVLPFKSIYKKRIQGIVHNYSRSGASVFLEPLPLSELNNDFTFLASEEKQEIKRLLDEIVIKIKRDRKIIDDCLKLALHLESLYIRAQWKEKHKCAIADFRDNKVEVKEAWYPPLLLSETKIIKNDFVFSEKEKIMVISGPNAGGKTVSLKTFYVVCELARRGFPVPAKAAFLPLFKEIFLVLGDKQDILEGESSFSAHLKELSHIANKANPKSLVLIDEIGMGTDPLQGGAIARAYLEYLKEKESYTVVTSHLAEVKTVALEDESFVPVAMEFDSGRSRPTYKFVYNLIGASNALSLVKKIDFPVSFVEKLEKLLLTKETSLEPLINRLKIKESELQKERVEIEKIKDEALLEKRNAEKTRKALEDKEQSFAEERLRLHKKLLDIEEKEIRRKVERLDVKDAPKRISEIKQKKGDIVHEIKKETIRKDTIEGVLLLDAKENVKYDKTIVYDRLSKLKGVLSSIKGKNATFSVGGKNFVVPISQLVVLKDEEKKTVTVAPPKVESSAFEKIDLRGARAEDAIKLVEEMIDHAYLGGAVRVIFVHGHGFGVIRNVVRETLDALSKHYPIEYSAGKEEEGGDGVTVVAFNRDKG